MLKYKPISGKKCIRIICNKFGFKIKRQRGSHVILVKENGSKIGTVVPLHKEIKKGTLKSILELAKIDFEEFEKLL